MPSSLALSTRNVRQVLLQSSPGDNGDDHHTPAAEEHKNDAKLEVSSRSSPWVRQHAVVDGRMGVQTMIPSGSSTQVAPAAPSGSPVSPALPVTPFTSQPPSVVPESYPNFIFQQSLSGDEVLLSLE